MRRIRRTGLAVVVAILAVLSLSSCIPATFAWGFVGDDGELQIALCNRATVTAIRLSVSDRPVSELVEEQSAVWSGPPVLLWEGDILNVDDLPDGWQKTNDLDLDGEWDRIDLALFDGDQYVDSAILDHRDISRGQWSLSPRPGLIAGTSSCPRPSPTELKPEASDTATAIHRLEQMQAIAMPEDEFWGYIALIGYTNGGASTGKLVEELSKLPAESVAGFEAQLRLQLNSLDRATIWNASEAQREAARTYDLSTSDWFTEYRCRIVVGGPESVQQALAGETLPEMTWGDGQSALLGAALAAYQRTDKSWDWTQLALPPSMGANPEGW